MKQLRAFFILLLLLPGPVHSAQVLSGSISRATAGTGRATPEASESVFSNPATLPFVRGYHFATAWAETSLTAQPPLGSVDQRVSVFQLSLLDHARDSIVPAALGYREINRKAEQQLLTKQREIRVGVGEYYNESFSFGLALSYRDFLNAATEQRNDQFIDADLAGIWSINKSSAISLQFENLRPKEASNLAAINNPGRTAIGMSSIYRDFLRTRLDISSNNGHRWNNPNWGLGFESYFNRWMVLRWGLGRDGDLNSSLWSAGIGFSGPRVQLHYATLQRVEAKSVDHSIDLSMMIW